MSKRSVFLLFFIVAAGAAFYLGGRDYLSWREGWK